MHTVKRTAPALVTLLLATGCAHYAPAPLSPTPDILAIPVPQAVAARSRQLERPFLQPVTIDLAAPLDGNALAALAVVSNPDLKALRARAGVAEAQAFAAGLVPDLAVNVGADFVVGGPPAVTNLVAALGLNLNALRTRSVRLGQAQALASQARLDLMWAEWQTAGAARIAAARILALTRSKMLSQSASETAEAMLVKVTGAVGRGDAPPGQLQGVRLAALDAAGRYRADEQALVAAKLELSRLLGIPPDLQIRVEESPLPSEPALDAHDLFDIAQRERPDLRALRAGYTAQESAVRLAVMEQFPTLDLTVNGTRDTGNNRLIGPAVAFSLPLWNRNRGTIAIESATREALRAEYDARVFRTRSEIATALAGLAVSYPQRAVLLSQIPALRAFADRMATAAGRGDQSLAARDEALQSVRDKEMLLVASEQAIAEQSIALELLTGLPRQRWVK
ncbi:MAG: TolC family protein [Gammaproteobacteria bacterium]|nr:TolC family protein [Gammaproteobacteria bacterium]